MANMASMPGPRGLPIIGNIHQLLGAPLHIGLTELFRQYGEVFCIKVGNQPVVILNGRNAIKQALVTQTVDFAGRPESAPTIRTLNSILGGVLAGTTYNEKWKFYHKLFVAAYNDVASGENKEISEKHVLEEASKFVDFVLTEDKPSGIFSPDVLINRVVVNLNTRFLFSAHHDLDDPFLIKFVELQEQYWAQWDECNLINSLPWMDWILPGRLSKYREYATQLFAQLRSLLDERNKEYVEGSKSDILHFLKTQRSNLDQQDPEYTEEKMESLILGNFPATQGPAFATLHWAFVYAILFPEIQKEIQDEIDRVVGRERAPTLADREKLPLTEAFIYEVIRHAAVPPFTIFRCTIRDTVLEGGYNFAIPEGRYVLCNLHSMCHDPKEWENPDQFNPRRFLKDDGESLDRDKFRSFLQFGGGVRKCLGYKIAMIHPFLFFAAVMHSCSLKKVAGEEPTVEGVAWHFGMRPQRATKMELVRR